MRRIIAGQNWKAIYVEEILINSNSCRIDMRLRRNRRNPDILAAEMTEYPLLNAVIFASPRPLTFAAVELRLKLSKGSVSQGLRFLKEIGAIKVAEARRVKVAQASQPAPERSALSGESPESDLPPSSSFSNRDANASTRASYVPDMELRRLAERLLKEKIEPQLNGNGRRLAQLVAAVPFADRDEARLVRERLKQFQSWHRKARKLVPFAKTVLALG